MRRRLLLCCSVLLACAPRTPLPPAPQGLRTVAVAVIENQTGSDLVVSGDDAIAKLLKRPTRAVPDVLRQDLRRALEQRGMTVVDGGDVPTLRVVLRRFEPDVPQLTWIEVALAARVVDPDGSVRWNAERSRWLVPVRGAPSLGVAYETAAQDVARALVEGWRRAQ
jgi:hypothetical protein